MLQLESRKGSLVSSTQVNTAVAKGHLAKGVVREVEKALVSVVVVVVDVVHWYGS